VKAKFSVLKYGNTARIFDAAIPNLLWSFVVFVNENEN